MNVSIEQMTSLNAKERKRLTALEETIRRGTRAFIEVGEALREVRDSRLYRETHATFEDYCADRFDLSRPYAYNLIDAARVNEVVSAGAHSAPTTERQARELAKLLSEPETLQKVWTAACATATALERPVTAEIVRETRRVLSTPAFTPAPPETDDRSKVTELRPRPAAEQDSRFEQIGDAVAMLESLPKPDAIVFPTSPGDMQSLDASLQWLSEWLPEVKRAWREHRKALTGRQVG